MTEWLNYETSLDGANALVDVDASFGDAGDRPACNTAIEVAVTGFPADADGLPTDAADDALYALEGSIESLLAQRGGVLAATVAGGGTYRFVAYTRDASAESELARAAKDAGLQATTSSHDDPAWQTYGRWSLSGEALEEARDRAQLDELESVGDDLSAEHDVAFDYEFDDDETADRAKPVFEEAGFDVADGEFGEIVQILVAMVPSAQEIGNVRRRLDAIAAHVGGAYAGWGSEPVGGE